MNNILEYSENIKLESTEFLEKNNVIKILEKFGKVKFTGSYELDLMFKKDIDISLINDEFSVPDFTQLGKELIDVLNTHSVYFRNTRITPLKRRPEKALYWGIKSGDWNIDLWAVSELAFSKSDKYIQNIKSLLNNKYRETILDLKFTLAETKEYGKKLGSKELYDAVLNYEVTNIEELEYYLTHNKKNIVYI
ncbi:MAG: hypothetical protein V3V16_10035 [Melioribacteraceae bacterium]